MSDYEVTIRLLEDQQAFVYSILRRDRVYESRVIEIEEEVAPGFYGGSAAMD